MAHTTLDLSPRMRGQRDDDQRPANFEPGDLADEAPHDSGSATVRRANYRPREEFAVRRDVVADFRNLLERDATHMAHNERVVLAALPAIARAEEVLGRFPQGVAALDRLEARGELSPPELATARRLYRQLGQSDEATAALEAAIETADEPWRADLLELERADQLWRAGVDVSQIAEAIARVDKTHGDFSTFWKTRLMVDAALERGDHTSALAMLGEACRQVDEGQLREVLAVRRAVWMSILGDVDAAAQILEDVRRGTGLEGDLGELLASLYFEMDDREAAARVLSGLAGSKKLEPAVQLGAAMLAASCGDSPGDADELLASLAERRPDDATALRTREIHLERHLDRPDQIGRPGEALIDVFNMQLEGPLSRRERVAKLTRLGRLYESEAGLEEAAAEVYREALDLEPSHVTALRALGRLYARKNNWHGLAELYEREIEVLDGAPTVWRRHFQLAQIYHHRLDEAQRALEHYRRVLDYRAHYLPALKSAARLLEELGHYEDLADLFLATVEAAPNRRQKLYLLDKVAEVAEVELGDDEVAIGAWREILRLDATHPRAYAALGRLYARCGRWEELIELNLREIELVEDAEETAVLRYKCAEIAERHLADPERAEHHYRAALDVVPDFLPALEGLGRLYIQEGRWGDIVEMSGRELQQTDDLREAVRRLGALAEIFETRMERKSDALRVYRRIIELDPANSHAFESAIRLCYALERYDEVVELLEEKLSRAEAPGAMAAVHGEVAMLAEWHLDDPARAFDRYLAALDAEPANAHWLAGVSRCWGSVDIAPEEIARRLEDHVIEPMPAEVRDRYFKVIARLRERAHRSVEASRAHRTHGSSDSLENQIALQLAMAEGGERGVLAASRRVNPHHPIERLTEVGRVKVDADDLDALRGHLDRLSDRERAVLLDEIEVSALADLPARGESAPRGLSADLVQALDGKTLGPEEDGESYTATQLRVRAIQALNARDLEAFVFWTRREIEATNSPELAVSRLVDVAEFADELDEVERRDEFLDEAAGVAFGAARDAAEGEAHTSEDDDSIGDGPVLDRLCEGLRGAERWELLRDCLRATALRRDLSDSRRLCLFRELAHILEDQLEDLQGTREALSHCFQLSGDPDYLHRLSVICEQCDDLARATRFQQRHFEQISQEDEPEACVESGMRLAELLLANPERLEDGIDCLEHLLQTYGDAFSLEDVRRRLAHAYVELGNAYRAVELFQDVLGERVEPGELEDWRRLVHVYEEELADQQTAYGLQWKIVASDVGGAEDLDALIDLAFGARRLEECASRLETLARESDDADRHVDLLARAGRLVEEDLMLPEEAARLYSDALEGCGDRDGRWLDLVRRRAFCLSQLAGREARALEEFRRLAAHEPFEPTTYRGMADLLDRAHSHGRARAARQVLTVLNCEVEDDQPRTKTEPTRLIEPEHIDELLLPAHLDGDVLEVLRAAMPLVHKVWADELPQKKAFEGVRLDKLDAVDASESLAAALDSFGIDRYKLEAGDSGPTAPQVLGSSSTHVWLNFDEVDAMDPPMLRFVAGYCAGLAWSELAPLLTIDGRRIWHLMEAVLLKQTGRGFDERVDVTTQQLVDRIASPFDTVARRRLVSALEPHRERFASIPCERWPKAVELFANRCGLAVCGDAAAAVRAVLRFHGWQLPLDAPETQQQIRRNDYVRDLIGFVLDDEYLEARYALGLSTKPTNIVR